MFKLRLGGKIRLGFMAVIAVMVVLSALVYYNLSTINNQATVLRDDVFKFASITNDVNDTSNLCAIAMLDYDNTGKAQTWERAASLNQQKIELLRQTQQQAQSNDIFHSYLEPLKQAVAQSNELTKLINATKERQEALSEVARKLNDTISSIFDDNTEYTFQQTNLLIQGGSQEYLQHTGRNAALIKEVDDAVYVFQEGITNAQQSHDSQQLSEAMQDLPELFVKLDELIARTSLDDKETISFLQQIKEKSHQMESLMHEFVKLFAARVGVEADREKLDSSISDNLAKISEMTMSQLAQGVDESVGMSRQAMIFLAAGLLVALVLGVIVSLIILRNILHPVTRAVQVLESCADGDFSQHIDSSLLARGDELGQLLRDVENMSQKLSATISQVSESATNVNDAAGQIRQGNHEVSERTQQQAAAIEETASAVEQMTGAIRNNAQHSQHANQLVQKTSVIANNGGEVLKRTINAMEEVSVSSRKINEVTNVVNEIAFQTNLLALNASVEAARAGEAGRGFAVVASEVRNLATRSGDAARQIQELISDSVGKVEQGNQLMAETATTLGEIIEHVGEVASVIAEISASGQEQATGIEEINKAVGQMDRGVQQNAALVEQTASASETMAHEAQQLLQQMSQFRVNNGNSMRRLPQP